VACEDRQTFVTRLVTTHGTRLRRFLVTRVRNRTDIPDLVQEIFLRLLRVPNHETIRAPEAYLFTVAHHVAMQQSLQEAAAPAAVNLDDVLPDVEAQPDANPELELHAQECIRVLDQALDRLPPKARATFLLHRRDGLSIDEISARLNISRPMAKKYLVKALVQFRRALEDAERS